MSRKTTRRPRGPTASTTPPARTIRDLAVPVAAVALTIACYGAALDAPIIWDDYFLYGRPNDLARSGGPQWTLFTAPPQSPLAGRPLSVFSYVANRALVGDRPAGFRLFSLALHAANTLLVWGLMRRTFRSSRLPEALRSRAEPAAAFAALLWCAHPLNSEAVVYLTQRTELLASTFYLATLYGAVRAWASPRSAAWSVFAVACCTCGMMSKETVATAPTAVVLYDLAFLSTDWRATLRRRAKLYLGLTATWLVLAACMASGPRSESVGFGHGVSAGQYLLWQSLAVARYARLTLFPLGLCLDHGDLKHPQLTGSDFVAAMACGATIVVALLLLGRIARRRPPLAFALFWFFLILAPTSSFVPIVTEWCAERRAYLAIIGPLGALVATGVCLLFGRSRSAASPAGEAPRGRAKLAIGAAGALLATSAILTVARALVYTDVVALWSDSVAKYPEVPRTHANLANMYFNEAQALKATDRAAAARVAEQALSHYEIATRLDASDHRMYFNLGLTLDLLDRDVEAEAAFRRAVQIRPDYVNGLRGLAGFLYDHQRPAEAIAPFDELVRIEPRDPEWYFGLGLSTLASGLWDRARDALLVVVQAQPERVESWFHLGRAYAELGDLAQSETALRRALQLDPQHAGAVKLLDRVLQAASGGTGS